MASNQIWFTLRFLGKRIAQYATDRQSHFLAYGPSWRKVIYKKNSTYEETPVPQTLYRDRQKYPAGRRMQLFHFIFTEPWRHTFAGPCMSFFPSPLIPNGGTILMSRRTRSQEGGRLPRPVDDLRPSGRQSLGRSPVDRRIICILSPPRQSPSRFSSSVLLPRSFPYLFPFPRLSLTHTFLFRVPSLSP